VGGRIVSMLDKQSGYEFLWRNQSLQLAQLAPGSAYDPNFFGGIDELLPNDLPETLHGIACPDHGELWTTALDYAIEQGSLVLTGRLPQFGLLYERRMHLEPNRAILYLNYRITNVTQETREFLWKPHAALNIGPGDRIICPAQTARVVDPEWSRRTTTEPFAWPHIAGERADIVPAKDGTLDFFYLYNLRAGQMAWVNAAGTLTWRYSFDINVFPYAWYFASYGGFDGHYVGVLEPCTSMPISVNEAAALGQCSLLSPGETMETKITIYAGSLEDAPHD